MTNQTDQKRARLSRYRQPTKEEKFWTCSETNNFAGQTAATRSEPALSPTNCRMSTLRDRPQLREASQLCTQQIVGCPLCGTDCSYAKRASSVPNKLSDVHFAGQTAATRSEPALSPTNCRMSTLRDRPQLREASQLCPQQIVGCQAPKLSEHPACSLAQRDKQSKNSPWPL